MSDRLVIYNKTQGKYVIIAKTLNAEWRLGNVNVLKEFLESSFFGDELIMGEDGELDTNEAENFNKERGWVYYEAAG